jgi:hypothetical protein
MMLNKTNLTSEELAHQELSSLIFELGKTNSFNCVSNETAIIELENYMPNQLKALAPDASSYYEFA